MQPCAADRLRRTALTKDVREELELQQKLQHVTSRGRPLVCARHLSCLQLLQMGGQGSTPWSLLQLRVETRRQGPHQQRAVWWWGVARMGGRAQE